MLQDSPRDNPTWYKCFFHQGPFKHFHTCHFLQITNWIPITKKCTLYMPFDIIQMPNVLLTHLFMTFSNKILIKIEKVTLVRFLYPLCWHEPLIRLTGWASLVANEWEGSESPTSRLTDCSCWQIPSRSLPTTSWPTAYWEICKRKAANSLSTLKDEEFVWHACGNQNQLKELLLPGKDPVLNAFLFSILHRLHLCPPTREEKNISLNSSGNMN